MLRIIAGKYRSRRLEQPPLEITRATIDRAREALFNILQTEIAGSVVLDCFAGSGAFCLEALSRGAAKAIAIEKNKIAYEIILKNVKSLGVENIEVKNNDALVYLKNCKNVKFDFIYLDPPYELDVLFLAMKLITENNILNKYGKIVIETNNEKIIEIPEGLTIHDQRNYGKTKFIFVSKN